MKKGFLCTLLVLLLLFAFAVLPVQAAVVKPDDIFSYKSLNASITPRFLHTYTKEYQVPLQRENRNSFYYTELFMGQPAGGHLYLVGGYWSASGLFINVYRGTMFVNI